MFGFSIFQQWFKTLTLLWRFKIIVWNEKWNKHSLITPVNIDKEIINMHISWTIKLKLKSGLNSCLA